MLHLFFFFCENINIRHYLYIESQGEFPKPIMSSYCCLLMLIAMLQSRECIVMRKCFVCTTLNVHYYTTTKINITLLNISNLQQNLIKGCCHNLDQSANEIYRIFIFGNEYSQLMAVRTKYTEKRERGVKMDGTGMKKTFLSDHPHYQLRDLIKKNQSIIIMHASKLN